MTAPASTASATTAVAEWAVWSTTVRLIVTDPDALAEARIRVEGLIAEVDQVASRFRSDSEVHAVLRANGRPVRVSPLLADLIRVALMAAEQTAGDVDPTVGSWLRDLGYDRNLADIPAPSGRTEPPVRLLLAPDWRRVHLRPLDGEEGPGELTVPAGVLLDLGATAKAYAADLCARAVADLGCGALVSIGGDIATAGAAPHRASDAHAAGFWRVRVQDGPDQPGTTVTLPGRAAIATSSTVHRRWRNGPEVLHHILDPRTGLPANPVWRTVTVVADTCVRANTASTAAVVRGHRATAFLAGLGLAARLVAADGSVRRLNGWPAERRTSESPLVAA